MKMFKLFVEGHGELGSANKLVQKIIAHDEHENIYFSPAQRMPGVHKDDVLKKIVDICRLDANTEGILIIRDDEDNCPRELAPEKARFLRTLSPPWPIAYCIMYREFETLFVAYADEFKGKTISHLIKGEIRFSETLQKPENPETIRGAKEWISRAMVGNRAYKPTVDQLSLTSALNVSTLIGKNLPCVQTLRNCISHLVKNKNQSQVYPL